jgi:hypothetical protein
VTTVLRLNALSPAVYIRLPYELREYIPGLLLAFLFGMRTYGFWFRVVLVMFCLCTVLALPEGGPPLTPGEALSATGLGHLPPGEVWLDEGCFEQRVGRIRGRYDELERSFQDDLHLTKADGAVLQRLFSLEFQSSAPRETVRALSRQTEALADKMRELASASSKGGSAHDLAYLLGDVVERVFKPALRERSID